MSDVSLPLNIDDADLSPGMTELPSSKAGWTSMTFSLINIDLVKSMQKLAAIATSSSPPFSPTETVRTQIINEARAQIETRLENCNPVIPRHRLTILCSRFLLRKLDFITRLQWLSLQNPSPCEDFITEENLIEALEILEPRLPNVSEDDLLRQFAWARKAYPQYYITMYVLRHLCVKPAGPTIDRAWAAIDTLFEQWDEFISGFGSKSAVLAALRAKAMSVREKMQARNRSSDRGLETGESQPGTGPLGDVSSGDFDINFDSNEWLDWTSLPQAF